MGDARRQRANPPSPRSTTRPSQRAFDGLQGMYRAESQIGWLTFEVPINVRLRKLRFVLDSGFAHQRGEWVLT